MNASAIRSPHGRVTIYNLPPSPARWDAVGVFYMIFSATWTVIVLIGMIFCWLNRQSPVLRIRGLPLSFASITTLHIYWVLAQIAYPIGPTIPVVLAYDFRYFFMGIWLALGIALLHASNLRFLHIAKLQKQFTHAEIRSWDDRSRVESSWLSRLRHMSFARRVILFVGAAMVLQVLLVVSMWLSREKYHPTFGIAGTGIQSWTVAEQIVELGRGWEWWPTVLWLAIWTWMVAPFILFRAWSIRDTMGWRVQTIGCCIASLHAVPMFMIAKYVPAFVPVNVYMDPSQWIHLSIMLFEVFATFVPAFQVLKLKSIQKKAASSSNNWEMATRTATLRTPTSSSDIKFAYSSSAAEKGQVQETSLAGDDLQSYLLTMEALEHVLNCNTDSLQEFSALCDFSGENIAFITRASALRSMQINSLGEQSRQEVFERALGIYIDFISPSHAVFPLNLPRQELRQLEAVFKRSARAIIGAAPTSLATPNDSQSQLNDGGSDAGTQFTGEVPEIFDLFVFDKAVSHVKYLVLTNTWPKFVVEMQRRKRVDETSGSVRSGSTVGSGVS
ncbi:hypothetical protein F5X68DRAFT_241801 [Plectosphaerella plurivora]|uniref:RGS domain-containing protein n=1 Tax=Plectosphaerella plurivora TaxID=936078 RepID=A0A9P9AA48_9PEZI|nr:hypothetical protein F5X68DRAFT_241801 [Plectosphaerella plurivora]